MERKQELRKFVIFVIASVVAIGALLWYNGYCHGITEARSEIQIVDSEKALDNQTSQEENNGQTDSEKGEVTNRTIWDVANSQANNDKYKYVGRFHEGLAYAAKEREGSLVEIIYGYIDEDGNEVIDFKYMDANGFSDGLAAVSKDGGKYGYIDHQGNWVIEPILDRARDFSDGKAKVQVGIKWYIIDKEGNILEEVKSD